MLPRAEQPVPLRVAGRDQHVVPARGGVFHQAEHRRALGGDEVLAHRWEESTRVDTSVCRAEVGREPASPVVREDEQVADLAAVEVGHTCELTCSDPYGASVTGRDHVAEDSAGLCW